MEGKYSEAGLIADLNREIAKLKDRIIELERYDSDDEIRCLKDDNNTLRERDRKTYRDLQDQIARNVNLEGKLKTAKVDSIREVAAEYYLEVNYHYLIDWANKLENENGKD